jgi:hypothetical protein
MTLAEAALNAGAPVTLVHVGGPIEDGVIESVRDPFVYVRLRSGQLRVTRPERLHLARNPHD